MKKNILVVDDNPDDLEFYTDLLERAESGYTVFTAQDAEQAVQMFLEHKIDCTFIDYFLPEMNGLMILEALTANSNGVVLPVVILTGEPNQTIQAEVARSGALDYIVKDVANTPGQIDAVAQKTIEWARDLNRSRSSVA